MIFFSKGSFDGFLVRLIKMSPTPELQWDTSMNLPSVLQNSSTVLFMRVMPFVALNAKTSVMKFHPLNASKEFDIYNTAS